MVLNFIKSSYNNVKNALAKTGSLLGGKLHALFQGQIDETTLDKLEQLLYESDLGVKYAQELTAKVRQRLHQNPKLNSEDLIQGLKNEILQSLQPLYLQPAPPASTTAKPLVFLIVGVNGNGKTTSVAKLAHFFQNGGKKIIVGAADTFRAAAMEQLETWTQRLKIDIVKGLPNSDPASVTFDTLTAAKARNADVVLIDTAGRLHTKIPLMQELEKIRRTCRKIIPDSPHETLLVLDATTGQNAVDQAKIFNQFTPLTGLILTKLDGTAKGGAVLAIQRALALPVKYIGVGEGIDDLKQFDPQAFVDTLFEG